MWFALRHKFFGPRTWCRSNNLALTCKIVCQCHHLNFNIKIVGFTDIVLIVTERTKQEKRYWYHDHHQISIIVDLPFPHHHDWKNSNSNFRINPQNDTITLREFFTTENTRRSFYVLLWIFTKVGICILLIMSIGIWER